MRGTCNKRDIISKSLCILFEVSGCRDSKGLPGGTRPGDKLASHAISTAHGAAGVHAASIPLPWLKASGMWTECHVHMWRKRRSFRVN